MRRVGVAGGRCFRLAHEISVTELRFAVPVPDTLDGPLELRLVLPDDPLPITAIGRAIEVAPEEEGQDASRRAIEIVSIDDDTRSRIARYIEQRMNP